MRVAKVCKTILVVTTVVFGVMSCGNKTFSELHGLKKELCACKTESCIKEVYAKLPQINEPPDSEERRGELLNLMSKMAECASAIKSK